MLPSEFHSLIESHTNTIGGNHEKAWPSGVVLNIMQIQTITADCQCKQELESCLPMKAMLELHARYLDKYFFKYDNWLENHLLIHTIAVTLRNLYTASKLKFELAGNEKS